MKRTKVRVKFVFRHPDAAEILPVGFETELIPNVKQIDGSFKDYTFKGANGNTYDGYWIYLMVGYKSIGDIFEKI